MTGSFVFSLMVSVLAFASVAPVRKPAVAPAEVVSFSLCTEGVVSNCVVWRRSGAGKKEKLTRERSDAEDSKVETLSKKQFESEITDLLGQMKKIRSGEDACQPSLLVAVEVKEGTARAKICSEDYDDKEWKQWARFLRR